MHPPDELERIVETAFRAATAESVERVSRRDWRFRVVNGTGVDLRARFSDEEWLTLSSALPSTHQESPWSLLRLNACLDGSVRIARRAHCAPELWADLFVDARGADPPSAPPSLVHRIASICDDFHEAHMNLLVAGISRTPDGPLHERDADRLARLCAEAGWPATLRSSGDLVVPMGTNTPAFDAHLSLAESTQLCAAVALTHSPVAVEASRDAIALLMLQVSAMVRTVRAVARLHGQIELPGFDVVTERMSATPAAIDRALGALAVACERTGREVQALMYEPVALDYLAVRRSERGMATSTNADQLEDTTCLQLP